MADARSDRRQPSATLNHQVELRLLLRSRGQIDIKFLFLAEVGHLRIAGYAYDLQIGVAALAQSLSDRIFSGPEFSRRGFRYDGYLRARPHLFLCKVPATDDRNSQHGKISVRDRVVFNFIFIGLAGNGETRKIMIITEWRLGCFYHSV